MISSPLDRAALITGGASGFGLAVARALEARGSRVAIADNSPAHLATAREALGPDALSLQTDVTSPDEVRAAVSACVERFGGLDTLVTSAGVIHIADLEDVAESAWDLTLDVNLKGSFLAAQAAAPALRKSGRGRIVAVGSDASKRGFPGIQAYCASKFGLVGLVESLAMELAPDQVTVNCVCPVGCPTTEMGKAVAAWKASHSDLSTEEVIAAAARTNPLGRNATEEDVVGTILFLLSEEASFLTGLAIDVDGGAHLGAMPGV